MLGQEKYIKISHNFSVPIEGTEELSPNIETEFVGEWAEGDMVGILLVTYMEVVKKFLEIHSCKDCRGYRQHADCYKGLVEVQNKMKEEDKVKINQ